MNKKEVTINTRIPLISEEEYNILNVEFHSIIGKFVKQNIKDKDLAAAQYIIKKQEQENTNLKQTLNEIREYIYKNSIPVDLLSMPPKHRLDFEGDINDILQIIDKALGYDEK